MKTNQSMKLILGAGLLISSFAWAHAPAEFNRNASPVYGQTSPIVPAPTPVPTPAPVPTPVP